MRAAVYTAALLFMPYVQKGADVDLKAPLIKPVFN